MARLAQRLAAARLQVRRCSACLARGATAGLKGEPTAQLGKERASGRGSSSCQKWLGMIEHFQLYRSVDKSMLPAVVIDEIQDPDLQEYNQIWIPQMRQMDQEDSHWNWERKMQDAISDKVQGYRQFSLKCDGRLQGLMQIKSKHQKIKNTLIPCVYVQYLAAAPWNRLPFKEFAGVGTVLLKVAAKVSLDEGFGGAIALHSLPGASGFYKKLGFQSQGPDPNCEDLDYMVSL